MSNWLSNLRALIVGAPKGSARLPLPILSAPVGSAPLPLDVPHRKYARSPLKVRGGRARARRALRDERGRFLVVIICAFSMAVHPSCARAQTPEDDWREIRPSAAASKTSTEAPSTEAQVSGSPLEPMIATGTISGFRSGGNPEMELRLRPQPNGFLHGELVIHQSGFGMTPLEGFVRGDHLQFQVPYGAETYYFEGQRRSDLVSGTFESTPSGERGTWSARVN
jgi:hypothetical protein